ncbi:MAG: hypothetical protein H6Q70_3933 [Firmicutes bacterium]|nr:hypothetical protein [Bacillota bacterium]
MNLLKICKNYSCLNGGKNFATIRNKTYLAASRNNTIDVLLVMVVLFVSLVFLKATEEGNLKK